MEEKKVLYSAVQPTNNLTIGNYVGAIRNWVQLQDEYRCYYAIANMHAITVRQDPAALRKKEEYARCIAQDGFRQVVSFECQEEEIGDGRHVALLDELRFGADERPGRIACRYILHRELLLLPVLFIYK